MADLLFTYDPSLPTDHDHLRFLLGDTDSHQALLDDREIHFCLAATAVDDPLTATDEELHQALYGAALMACKGILAKLAGDAVDRQIGDERVAFSQRYTQYRNLLDKLRIELSGGGTGTVKLVRV
jgi:hypothetical protein